MMWLANLILQFFGGPILKGLLEGYRMKLEASNRFEQHVADLAIKDVDAEIEAQRSAREIRLATAGFWEMRLLTFGIAFPFVLHLWLVALDTILEIDAWTVEKLPQPFNEWEGTILLSFFGVYATTSAVKSFSAAIATRRG